MSRPRFSLRQLLLGIAVVCSLCAIFVSWWDRAECVPIRQFALAPNATLSLRICRDTRNDPYWGAFTLREGDREVVTTRRFGRPFYIIPDDDIYYKCVRTDVDVVAIVQRNERLAIKTLKTYDRDDLVDTIVKSFGVMFIDEKNKAIFPGDASREQLIERFVKSHSPLAIEPHVDMLAWITKVEIGGQAVSVDGIRSLSALPNLSNVEFYDANVDVEEIDALLAISTLKHIRLDGACPSTRALTRLLKKLPRSIVSVHINPLDALGERGGVENPYSDERVVFIASPRNCSSGP